MTAMVLRSFRILKSGLFQSNIPFRRVREEEVAVDPRLADNSFDAKVSEGLKRGEPTR